jgi:hypothetical protein
MVASEAEGGMEALRRIAACRTAQVEGLDRGGCSSRLSTSGCDGCSFGLSNRGPRKAATRVRNPFCNWLLKDVQRAARVARRKAQDAPGRARAPSGTPDHFLGPMTSQRMGSQPPLMVPLPDVTHEAEGVPSDAE